MGLKLLEYFFGGITVCAKREKKKRKKEKLVGRSGEFEGLYVQFSGSSLQHIPILKKNFKD